MESDTSEKKKISLEKMPKEEIIKKYNNLLLIAKKAKQSKNETFEELQKIKAKEFELISEIKTLKELLAHYTKEEFSEQINQKEKYIELKNIYHKIEDDIEKQSELKLCSIEKGKELSQKFYEELKSILKKRYEKKDISNIKLEEEKLDYEKKIKSTEESLENEKIIWHKEKIVWVPPTEQKSEEKCGKKIEMEESEEKIKKNTILISDKEQLLQIVKNIKGEILCKSKKWERKIEVQREKMLELKKKKDELEKKLIECSHKNELKKAVEKIETESRLKCQELEKKIKNGEKKCEGLDRIAEELKRKPSVNRISSEEFKIEKKAKLENVKIRSKEAVENQEKTKTEMQCSVKRLNDKENIESQIMEEKNNIKESFENLTNSTDDYEKLEFDVNFTKAILNSQEKQKISEFEKRKKESILEVKTESDESRNSGNEKLISDNRKSLERLFLVFNEIKVIRKEMKEELKEKLKTFLVEQNAMRRHVEEAVLKYAQKLHDGNSELLSEMNIMNQALKERGETISKLEQFTENQRKEMDELKGKIMSQAAKLQGRNKRLEELEEEVGKAKSEVESKHKALREMEEEMWRWKNGDAHGETLSSSTISKTEESTRLAELEESFEERYSKLKIIAVKLKKKVSDLQKQAETERSKLLAAEEDYQSKITNFQNQIKSLKTIQTQYDTLQDLLDDERKEKTCAKASLELMQREMSSFKRELEEVKAERDKYKTEKTSCEKVKKELAAHIGELKQTLNKQKSEYNQLEKQIQELKDVISVKNRQVEEEKEKNKKTIMFLEEQKVDSKKQSLLELEMAAYEKTAEELKNRLDKKDEEIKEFEKLLEKEKATGFAKDEEIRNLVLNVADAQLKVADLNGQVTQLNEKLNELLQKNKKKSEMIKSLENKIEEKNNKIENVSFELENLTKEKYKTEESFKRNEEKLCKQVHCLEEQLNSAKDILNQRDTELEELKKEFQGYKVRAQSVLRQSQKETNPSRQQNALEELEQLRSTCESLKIRLEDLTKKLQKTSEENGGMAEEKKRLFERVQELNNCVAELRDENQTLKRTRQKESEEYAEILRMQKLQSDTLSQCFQKELKNLQEAHSTQVDELKKEIEVLQKNTRIRFEPIVKRLDARDDSESHSSFLPVKPEKDVLDVSLIEREECEGSESVETEFPQGGGGAELIPLEQLLSTPKHVEVSSERKNSLDVNQMKFMLDKSENRIKHLTLLLAEAESDSARLNQLNEVLKDEIRRHQRSLEREKHAQNFEYLKNVFVKFVSLQNVDEKLRLIPVLNTILKLSPEEEIIVTNCAKGLGDQGSRAWGSYLHIWPSS